MADSSTTTFGFTLPEVGASQDTWGGKLNDNFDDIDDCLDGTTAIKPNLTVGQWQVGGTAVTSTAAELNVLDGITATTTELNYCDGVTSNIQTQLNTAFQAAYPVGSIYMNASVSTNPATLLGFGTWISFGEGRVLVGVDSSDASFDTLGETGGSKNAIVVSHSHSFSGSTSGVGDHTHTYQTGYNTNVSAIGSNGNFGGGTPDDTSSIYNTSGAGAHSHTYSGTTSSSGSSGTNANLQPYITVYMWRRTA